MKTRRQTRAGLIGGCAISAVLACHPTVQAANAPPDLSGIYLIAGSFMPEPKLPPPYKPQNPDLDSLSTAHLLPWAKARIDASDPEADDTGAVCQLAGIFRHPTTVAGFQWMQVPGKVLLLSTDVQEVGVRRVYLTRKHPLDVPYTWDGNSIGHWENDTLVVDTTGFNDKSWLFSGMEPHTEELHVVERYKPLEHGRLIEVSTTVDDRMALTGPYSFTRYYMKVDSEFPQEVCNGSPGEPERWNGIRQDALARVLAKRTDSVASAGR